MFIPSFKLCFLGLRIGKKQNTNVSLLNTACGRLHYSLSIHTIVGEPVQTILLFSSVLHALHDYHGGYYAAT